MIKTVIIDDEKWVRMNLRSMLNEECSHINNVGMAESLSSGLECIEKNKPDLVFLDIQLRDGTGFDLLDQLPSLDFQVIFITAYDEFAIKAFRYSAIDYLLKPVHPDELKKAVDRAVKAIKLRTPSGNLASLLDNLRKDRFEKISIPTNDGFSFIHVDSIIRIEADSNYSVIYLKEEKKQIVTKTLKEFDDMLGQDHFIRVHRSHLVNIHFVKKHSKNEGGSLLLTNGDIIPISRRKRDEFQETIKSFFDN